MESFGKILAAAREQKNYSIEVVSRETAISRQYLEALESERLDVFPGTTYITGFLRNYSDYLGCDTQYLIRLFKAKQLQESPTPPELIKFKRRIPWWVFLIIAVVVVGLGVGGFFTYKSVMAKRAEGKTVVNLNRIDVRTYVLGLEPEQQHVYEGDILCVPFVTGKMNVTIAKTLGSLTLNTFIGNQIVELGEELELDVDGNGKPDISVCVMNISSKDADQGAEIRMRLTLSPDQVEIADQKKDETDVAEKNNAQVVLITDNRTYPFTLTGSFRGACLFRYQADRNNAVEEYYTNGDSLVINPRDSLRMWMSNANAVKLNVVGDTKSVDIEIGKSGEVVVEDIRWIRDSDGTYKLVVLPVD
ncbi:MAG: helix-turn-helix domain-containing protein [Treponema sp.]|nr:helix-turn-helix domain-containing protein [Candidatus Treponema caballi]